MQFNPKKQKVNWQSKVASYNIQHDTNYYDFPDMLIDLVFKGTTYSAIARIFDVHYVTIIRRLKQLNIYSKHLNNIDWDEKIEQYNADNGTDFKDLKTFVSTIYSATGSCANAAAILDVSDNTVRLLLKKFNIPRTTRRGPLPVWCFE